VRALGVFSSISPLWTTTTTLKNGLGMAGGGRDCEKREKIIIIYVYTLVGRNWWLPILFYSHAVLVSGWLRGGKKQFTECDCGRDTRTPNVSITCSIYNIINHIIYTLSVIMSLLYKFAAAIVLVTTAERGSEARLPVTVVTATDQTARRQNP